MGCDDFERQDTTERYLLGQLTDVERDEFEQHYIECESCFARLQTNLALQTELQRQPPPRPYPAALWNRAWAWSAAFAALLVVMGLGVWWSRARQDHPPPMARSSPSGVTEPAAPPSPAVPGLQQLARVDPPPYVAVVLRGAEDRAHEVFRLAMQDYMKGDYSAAIPGLRNAVNASPRTAGYQFYLGASYLLTSQFEPAVDALGKAATLDDTAYTEPAHFYLAKAYLNVGNVSAAEAELQTTVRLGGGYEAQARAILHQLR